jgi:hypothetical protein
MNYQDIFLTLNHPKRRYKKWKRFHFTDLLGKHKIVSGGIESDGTETRIHDLNMSTDSYEVAKSDCKK